MKFGASLLAGLLLTLGSRNSLRWCALACSDHENHSAQARSLAGSKSTSPRPSIVNSTRTLQEFQRIRLNCGSNRDVIGPDGQTWKADAGFHDGGYPLEKPRLEVETIPKVPAEIFLSMRRSMAFASSFTYEFPVPNGEYVVAFYFAELVYDAIDERLFVIKMEDEVKFDNVDIVELAGGQFKGTQLARKTFVLDGVLTLEFIALKGNAAISGLQVLKTNNSVDPVPTPISTIVPVTSSPVEPQPTETGAPGTLEPVETAKPIAAPLPSTAPVVTVPPVATTPTDVSFEPILINTGGGAFTDLLGRQWDQDKHFTGGSTFERSRPISNTEDDILYTSERYGTFSYRFEIPVATYEVILHFAETIFTEEKRRLFTIKIQNEVVHDNIDLLVLSEGQPLMAFTLESTEVVSDGYLLIEFVAGDSSVPKINGIEVNYLEPHLAHSVADGPFVGVAGANDMAVVDLDGSPSHTHGFELNLVEWAWKMDGNVVSTSESDSIEFPVGEHVVTLFVKDDGGNEDADSTTVRVFPAGFPDVLSLSPSEGLVDGYDTITIIGSGFNYFAGETIIYFGDQEMTGQDIEIVDANTIRVTAPKAAVATPVPVSVKTPLGISNEVLFTYVDGVPIEFESKKITSISSPTTVAFGVDGKLYVGTVEGMLYKLTLDDEFNVLQTVESNIVGDRQILGLTFDPMDTSANPSVYVSHSKTFHGEALSTSGESINGKVSKVSGSNLDVIEDVVTGLPVSDHDHAINGLEFGDHGELYIQVAGNTNSGVEGRLSTTRKLKDNALSSATLVAYLSSPGFDGNIRYDADDDGSVIPGSGVEIFAYGFRNPYDIDNGPDVNYGDRLMGCSPLKTLPDVEEEDRINWIQRGHYYGMPNLKRGQIDQRQCRWRSVNEPSDDDYTAPLAVVPSSIDGIVEFQTNHFNGQLRGDLIVAKYKKELYRLILNDDGTEIIPQSIPPIEIGGGGTLDVTQAPSGSLVDARYLVGAIHYYRPVEPETTDLVVKGVFPRRGDQAGGSHFAVYGVNMDKYGFGVTVSVGGTTCPLLNVFSNKITCTLPGGNGTADIQVAGGQEVSLFERGYRYITGKPAN